MELKLRLTTGEMEQVLLDLGVEENFINGATCIGGYCKDTMESVLYYHTGFRNFDQYGEIMLEDNETEYTMYDDDPNILIIKGQAGIKLYDIRKWSLEAANANYTYYELLGLGD